MKQIFTLLAIALFATTANAQFTETFEGSLASCWTTTNVGTSSGNGGNGITGKSATLINNGSSVLATPFLDIPTGSVTIQFDYALSGNLQVGKTRVMQVGIQDKYGVFQQLGSTINVTSTTKVAYNNTYTFPDGTYRVVIKETGDGGNDLVYIDNMAINASKHYTATCNATPAANPATFNTVASTPYSGSLSSYASDANTSEVLTFSVVAQPSNGTVSMNTDGTFTYSPAGGFVGGPVTFTYKVKDNGYEEATSTTATVTINYPALSTPLPVHVISFNGSIVNHKAELSWSVAENETGDHFEVEKSLDGSSFTQNAIVMNTTKQGSESYTYTDAALNGTSYYRFKIVNKSGTIAYSRTIMLKESSDIKSNNLTLVQNPVLSSLNFNFTASANGLHAINLYNTAGVKIFSSQMTMQKGMNSASLSVDSRIVPGIYIMEVTNGSDKSIAKFIKQ